VLYQNPALPPKNYDTRGQMSVQNNDERDTVASQMTHNPPPNYRAATGSSVGSPGKPN